MCVYTCMQCVQQMWSVFSANIKGSDWESSKIGFGVLRGGNVVLFACPSQKICSFLQRALVIFGLVECSRFFAIGNNIMGTSSATDHGNTKPDELHTENGRTKVQVCSATMSRWCMGASRIIRIS